MAGEGFWRDEATWRAILARLPEYRLSKFQQALPEAIAVELVGAYLLDAEGTRAYLG
jgi:ATP-dependent Lhr-like helicase